MKYIMLHGLGQSSESWSDTVKVFNDDFEVLCPNLSDWLSGKTPCYDTCIGHWKHTVNSLKNR